jgi:hypothetical protein
MTSCDRSTMRIWVLLTVSGALAIGSALASVVVPAAIA